MKGKKINIKKIFKNTVYKVAVWKFFPSECSDLPGIYTKE